MPKIATKSLIVRTWTAQLRTTVSDLLLQSLGEESRSDQDEPAESNELDDLWNQIGEALDQADADERDEG